MAMGREVYVDKGEREKEGDLYMLCTCNGGCGKATRASKRVLRNGLGCVRKACVIDAEMKTVVSRHCFPFQ